MDGAFLKGVPEELGIDARGDKEKSPKVYQQKPSISIIMLSNNSSNNDGNNNNNRKWQRRLIVASEEMTMQEDLLLVIFSFITVPDLLWMKLVCHHWCFYLIDVAVDNKLPSSGRIAFKNKTELLDVINKYCCDKCGCAEKIARTHGWLIGIWDVLEVTDFSCLFWDKNEFNDDISKWNTTNVTTIYCMFRNASLFNGNITSWNTSNVKNMNGMFYGASSFNGNISSWNTSNVKNMSFMFHGASSFNGKFSLWETSNVKKTWLLCFVVLPHSMGTFHRGTRQT